MSDYLRLIENIKTHTHKKDSCFTYQEHKDYQHSLFEMAEHIKNCLHIIEQAMQKTAFFEMETSKNETGDGYSHTWNKCSYTIDGIVVENIRIHNARVQEAHMELLLLQSCILKEEQIAPHNSLIQATGEQATIHYQPTVRI